MPGPLAYAGIAAGTAIAGQILKGPRKQPRSFTDFLSDYESRFAPERYGLPPREYQLALNQGRREILTQRDRGTNLALTQLRQGGLGRSAAAGTVSLRSAASAEQAYAQMLARLNALDQQLALQQQSEIRRQAIAGFQAQGQEDARTEAFNLQADAQFGNQLASLVDPIESYYLLRDLRTMRALQYQPSGANFAPNTAQMFQTADTLGEFDLNLPTGGF